MAYIEPTTRQLNIDEDITQMHLETKSKNHQDVNKNEDVPIIKRYLKTVLNQVGFIRYNDRRERIDGLLRTSVPNSWYPGANITWRYNDEVIHLYEGESISNFEKANAKLFNEGILIEYDPDTEYTWHCQRSTNPDNAYSYDYILVENASAMNLPEPTASIVSKGAIVRKGNQ